mmetsp:Transcript_23431/g.44491  ORF Transcript_23431/g.44491 Transcript_23431/m.44491 type:complete len:99 (+) Transcript_23431:631-927(+)
MFHSQRLLWQWKCNFVDGHKNMSNSSTKTAGRKSYEVGLTENPSSYWQLKTFKVTANQVPKMFPAMGTAKITKYKLIAVRYLRIVTRSSCWYLKKSFE